jgi:hypothetical protein
VKLNVWPTEPDWFALSSVIVSANAEAEKSTNISRAENIKNLIFENFI